jgi:uncharacterized protein
MKIGLISDTHGALRPEVFHALRGVDLILHAGDVGPPHILTELEAIAPVHAVFGNTDGFDLLPRVQEVVTLELEGHRIVMLHGHQLGSPTPERLQASNAGADVIVYGHTHRQQVDTVAGCLVVNPGAAGPARFDLRPSVAILTLEQGADPHVEHVPLTG